MTVESRSSPSPHLRPAQRQDVAHLAVSLGEAFYDDPVFGWLLPDEQRRQARLRRFFSVELERLVLVRGRAWTCAQRAGVAMSLPPGAWHSPVLVALAQGFAFGIRVPFAGGLLGRLELHHLRRPHYYFPYIGVAPAAQGRGLGSQLMRPTLDRCDAEGLSAYLEASSERNAVLYERLGFRLLRELSFAGSPPLRLMERRPEAG